MANPEVSNHAPSKEERLMERVKRFIKSREIWCKADIVCTVPLEIIEELVEDCCDIAGYHKEDEE